MAETGYVVERVVICDAYEEPDRHYQLLPGGRSKLVQTRRPSMSFLASARDERGGVSGILGKQGSLFEDLQANFEARNDFVNKLREEVRAWRRGEDAWAGNPYGGTALVTRRLLEWWFEREEERKAVGKRFFFCQREAVETAIYLYEVKTRYKMPATGDFLRYALKLATGTGKTVVMALLITWATLHKRKVSGSTLSANFLVLTPNLTVLDRVSGGTRGDGLDPTGEANLYAGFEMVPPEYLDEFRPNVLVKNWQSVPLDGNRDDWIPEDNMGDGRFIPASVLWALQRRARQDPAAGMRKWLGGWRDVIIINDEAHHAYGEKRVRRGEEPDYIRWSKILDRVRMASRVGLVVDVSATPWYGSGSTRETGQLYEWLVSDFSVYDAFESGLVKVVRLPDPVEGGAGGQAFINLWDEVREAKTAEEYIAACKGAIAALYSSWKDVYQEWASALWKDTEGWDPSPVMLVVASDGQRAKWLYDHLTREYDELQNPDGSDDDPSRRVTIQIDSKVFDANQGTEGTLREMVSTVGKRGMPGERVRCIVSVNMLTEGWDVKSVTHILGVRAFGSPLLTEQIIGRGLRRTSYDVLNQPLAERPEGSDETVDVFGIPFVGFPVQRRKRPRIGHWGEKPVWIEPADAKRTRQLILPNVRSWALGATRPLGEVVRISDVDVVTIDPRKTPPEIILRPVIGNDPAGFGSLKQFREENPPLKVAMEIAVDLYERTNPVREDGLEVGPPFEELLALAQTYLAVRVHVLPGADIRDAAIYYWRMQIVQLLYQAIQQAMAQGADAGSKPMPIHGSPAVFDTATLRRFQWTGLTATGRKSHLSYVACHSPLEKNFADFLDRAPDVARYVKNERLGFSVTYYEHQRPRQYFPDFLTVTHGDDGHEIWWVIETKGEVHANTALKSTAARLWCNLMTAAGNGTWRYLFVQQRDFERLDDGDATRLSELAERLVEVGSQTMR